MIILKQSEEVEAYIVEFGEVLVWVLSLEEVDEVGLHVEQVPVCVLFGVAATIYTLLVEKLFERGDLLGRVFACLASTFDALDILKREVRVEELRVDVLWGFVALADHENFCRLTT